jgi:hypothetical protein
MLNFSISYLGLIDATERDGKLLWLTLITCVNVNWSPSLPLLRFKQLPHMVQTKRTCINILPLFCEYYFGCDKLHCKVGKFFYVDILALYTRVNIYTMHFVKFSCFPFDYLSQLVNISDLPYCHFDGLMYILGSPLPKGQ